MIEEIISYICRDMCRTEQWAFDDYKSSKIAAYNASKSFMGYKEKKGESKLLKMLREKYNR